MCKSLPAGQTELCEQSLVYNMHPGTHVVLWWKSWGAPCWEGAKLSTGSFSTVLSLFSLQVLLVLAPTCNVTSCSAFTGLQRQPVSSTCFSTIISIKCCLFTILLHTSYYLLLSLCHCSHPFCKECSGSSP